MTDTTTVAPFRFFDLTVVRTEPLSPSLTRVTFGGAGADGFASGGRDQSLSLFLPHPGQRIPVMPTGADWFNEYRALDPDVRAVLRSYTVRAQRTDADGGVEVDIDFVLHAEPAGPAATWAARAAAGDRVIALGPAVAENTGVRFRLPQGTDWTLLVADETALPAAAACLESLPPGHKALVWVTVPHDGDRLDLRTAADAEVTWLVGGDAEAVVEAVRAAELPAGTPYAWLAGESGLVKQLRRQLVRERGIDRRAVSFTGYWRRGVTEDQLRAEAAAPAEEDGS